MENHRLSSGAIAACLDLAERAGLPDRLLIPEGLAERPPTSKELVGREKWFSLPGTDGKLQVRNEDLERGGPRLTWKFKVDEENGKVVATCDQGGCEMYLALARLTGKSIEGELEIGFLSEPLVPFLADGWEEGVGTECEWGSDNDAAPMYGLRQEVLEWRQKYANRLLQDPALK